MFFLLNCISSTLFLSRSPSEFCFFLSPGHLFSVSFLVTPASLFPCFSARRRSLDLDVFVLHPLLFLILRSFSFQILYLKLPGDALVYSTREARALRPYSTFIPVAPSPVRPLLHFSPPPHPGFSFRAPAYFALKS